MRESKGDEVLAQHRARELINFSRRGTSSTTALHKFLFEFLNEIAFQQMILLVFADLFLVSFWPCFFLAELVLFFLCF